MLPTYVLFVVQVTGQSCKLLPCLLLTCTP
jgi:hypothetical protein